MSDQNLSPKIPVRIPVDLMREAAEAAERDGVSLQDFVAQAVRSKVARLEAEENLAKVKEQAQSDGAGLS